MHTSRRSRAQQLPPWEGQAASLVVGIEQEHFIYKKGDIAPSLDDLKTCFEQLVREGFNARQFDEDSRPLVVNLEVNSGYVSIKSDFATHILEAAFPPMSDPEALHSLMTQVWGTVRSCLSKNGISVRSGGLIEALPANFSLVPHERREWLPSRPRPTYNAPFWHKYFNVLMCSTQVHLNILDADFFQLLETYYAYDYLAPLLYSNSRGSENTHCVRPLLWRDSFHPDYKAFAIPLQVPLTASGYESFLESSSDFRRDYSFISPRQFGSSEFRSACSQNDPNGVIEVAALRLLNAVAIQNRLVKSYANFRDHFYSVCLSGKADPKILEQHFRALTEAAKFLPNRWQSSSEKCLKKIRSCLG